MGGLDAYMQVGRHDQQPKTPLLASLVYMCSF